MKHLKYILILVLLTFSAAGCYFSRPVPVESLISVHIDRVIDGNTVQFASIYPGDSSLQELYDIFYSTYLDDKAEPESDLEFRLTLNYSNGSASVPVIFDLDKGRAFVFRENHYYALPDGLIREWLDLFPQRDLLTIQHLPPVSFEFNGTEFTPAVDSTWFETVYTDVAYLSNNVELAEPTIETDTFDNKLLMDSTEYDNSVITASVYRDNLIIFEKLHVETGELPTPEENGTYRYVVKLDSNSDRFTSNSIYTFTLLVKVPTSYEINATEAVAGGTLSFEISQPDPTVTYEAVNSLTESTVPLYPYGDRLIGISALDSRTGEGDFDIDIRNAETGEVLHTFDCSVSALDSPRQNLVFSSSAGSVATQENYDYDNAKRAEAYASGIVAPLWVSTFLQPVEGRITTEYATRRYYNGSRYESARHTALDIAAPIGTTVAATNAGKVVLAEPLKVAGNAVIIDHGMGIYSTYYHLSSIDVEKGDTVDKGETIGTVGSTGFSTGAHLHWSIYKDGVYLNPWQLIERDPLEGLR